MKIRLFYEKNRPFVAEPEMEDSDSADEKVEHYLESPEKEPQKSPEKEQPQKEENKTCEIAASQVEQVSFSYFHSDLIKKNWQILSINIFFLRINFL